MIWFILGTYLGGMLFTYRFVFRRLIVKHYADQQALYGWRNGSPNKPDHIEIVVPALGLASMWPIYWAILPLFMQADENVNHIHEIMMDNWRAK